MNFYSLLTIVIVLSAAFSYLNFRFIKWPQTISIMVMSLLMSVIIFAVGSFIPALKVFSNQLLLVDFHQLLMKVMLGFLLFAGSFHINFNSLKKQAPAIFLLAVVGTLLSTLIVGCAAYYISVCLAAPVPFIYCLMFGALISPTDPIAVLGILKDAKVPESLELKIAGESLFNDGIAVVVFATILEISGASDAAFQVSDVVLLFLREAVGGALYGVLLGYAGYHALRSIDNYKVEVLITLALVMGGYLLADEIHVSGPIAMVVAGLITGNKGQELAMSDLTRDYVSKFWELVDEILNAILFLFIGLEMLVIRINMSVLLIGVCMIAVVLLARWLSVLFPILAFRRWIGFEGNAVKILTWGGLRGGISVALALSLPASGYRDLIIAVTYIIVVFSILVQGLTIGKLSRAVSQPSNNSGTNA